MRRRFRLQKKTAVHNGTSHCNVTDRNAKENPYEIHRQVPYRVLPILTLKLHLEIRCQENFLHSATVL